LWNEFNDPTKTRVEIISNVPLEIDKDQWARFVHYRHKPSTLVKLTTAKMTLGNTKFVHDYKSLPNHNIGNNFARMA